MSRWWRAYDDALHEPKLLALSDRLHRAWFGLLCIASKNGGVLPAIATVAIELRTTVARAAEYITALVVAELFDEIEPGKFAPHNWEARQFKSDVTDPTAAERMRNYRNRKRNGAVTDTPTREQIQRTETEADTESASLRSAARGRAKRLASDWSPAIEDTDFAIKQGLTLPEIDREALKFRNHWTAKAGRDATKLDWSKTWQNWILNVGGRNGARKPIKQSHSELAFELAGEVRERELAAGIRRPDDPIGGH